MFTLVSTPELSDDCLHDDIMGSHAEPADKGFSLIELIVVVLIMGIVSSIAVVSFSSVQNTAYNTVVVSDLRNSSQSLEKYYMDTGRYPAAAGHILTEQLVISKDSYAPLGDRINFIYCVTKDRENYAIFARSGNERFSKSSLYGLDTGSHIPSSHRPFCTRYLDVEYAEGDAVRPYDLLWARTDGEWHY